MKFIFSFLALLVVRADDHPGQGVYDMAIDALDLGNDVTRTLKGVYPHFAGGVRALNGKDCELLKHSSKEILFVVKDLVKVGTDKILKENEFEPQMTMMAQMAQSFLLTQLQSQAEHLIENHACVIGGVHEEEL